MKVLKCDVCGCYIPQEKVYERIEKMRKEGFISREEARKAKKNIEKGKPFVKCHSPDCPGLLKPVREGGVQVDLSQYVKSGEETKNSSGNDG